MSPELGPTGRRSLTFKEINDDYPGVWVVAEVLADDKTGIVLAHHQDGDIADRMANGFPGFGSDESEINYILFQTGAQTA